MGRFAKAWKALFPSKNVQRFSDAGKESAAVRALKSQIKTQEAVIEAYEQKLIGMSEVLSENRQSSVEDKIVDVISAMLMPNSIPPLQDPGAGSKQTQLESGAQISDSEIKARLDTFTPDQKQRLSQLPLAKFSALASAQMPGISQESITKAYEMLKQ